MNTPTLGPIRETQWLRNSEISWLLAALGFIDPTITKGEGHDLTKRIRTAVETGRLEAAGPKGPWRVTQTFADECRSHYSPSRKEE